MYVRVKRWCPPAGEYGRLLVTIQYYSHRPNVRTRAGKNLRFFRNKFRFLGFLGFLGFNVRTVARGTLDSGHRNMIKKKAYMYTRRLTNALLCLTLRNNSNAN